MGEGNGKSEPLKLQLCCGKDLIPGYINVDCEAGEGITVVDLNSLPWPWPDGSASEIVSNNGLEHLAPLGVGMGQKNIIAILEEIWRVLAPGGGATIIVPSTDGRGAFQDPTHVTYWNQHTFLYFIAESNLHKDYGEHYKAFTVEVPEGSDEKLGVWTMDEGEDGTWAVARFRKPK